jgi:hypothetical protein
MRERYEEWLAGDTVLHLYELEGTRSVFNAVGVRVDSERMKVIDFHHEPVVTREETLLHEARFCLLAVSKGVQQLYAVTCPKLGRHYAATYPGWLIEDGIVGERVVTVRKWLTKRGAMGETVSDKLIRNALGGMLALGGAFILRGGGMIEHVGSWFWFCGLAALGANLAHGLGKFSWNMSQAK